MKKFSGAHENSHSKNTGLNPGSVEGSSGVSSPQHGFAMANSQSCAETKLEACSNPTTRYPRLVELFARTDRSTSRRAVAKASTAPALRLAEVAKLVQPHIEQVETRIAQQTSAFDPAIEGYVVYAVGSRGKRLRPLLALLAGGATGKISSNHVDLAVLVKSFTSPPPC